MKKFLCLVLVLVVFTSFMVGCSSDTKDAIPDTNQTDIAPNDVANSQTLDESENISENADESGIQNSNAQQKNPVASSPSSESTSDDKPDIYFITTGGSDADSISYHLKDCSALSGKEHQQISWEMVSTLGFRNCTKCKPPKYEGYIE